MQQRSEILESIKKNQTFALFGHEHIDGDALGAILAFGSLLEKQGKTVSYFSPHSPGRVFEFLQWQHKVQTNFDYGNYDVLIFLDFNHYQRISPFSIGHEDYFEQRQKIVIDHHKADKTMKNALIYRDTSEISTCSLITKLTNECWKELFDENIATYLYMGLSTDSGNFRYDEGEQSIRTFETALQLLKFGAKKTTIINEIFRNKTYRSIQFMQLLLQRMQKVKILTWENEKSINKLNIIYSFYEDQELETYQVDHDEADYALYQMQDIRNNDLVLLFKKVGIFFKTSLRSRGKIDCAALANHFWGWGHHNAAGFKMQSSGFLQQDIQQTLKTIQEQLKWME